MRWQIEAALGDGIPLRPFGCNIQTLTEWLIELPTGGATHALMTGSDQVIDPALIRLSAGLERIDDLKADLAQAIR